MVANPETRSSSLAFSAVIITHNVARTIGECLTALRQVTDDIVVLDTDSDDGTVDICRQAGARLVRHEWLGYAATKNSGNQLAKHDWILSIDADEVLSPELIFTLQNLQLENRKVYALDRLTDYCGQFIRHSGWYPDWKIRLFDRRQVWWQGDFVHETLAVPADYQEVRLDGKLYHYSYTDRNDHLRRIEKYALLSAREQFAAGKKATFVKRWLSPPARVFRTVVLKAGFLDGRAGLIIGWRDGYLVWRRYQHLQVLWQNAKTEK